MGAEGAADNAWSGLTQVAQRHTQIKDNRKAQWITAIQMTGQDRLGKVGEPVNGSADAEVGPGQPAPP